MTVLSAESLGVRTADGTELLADVSLSVAAGEAVVLCGPPGCGKTLLAKALRGLLTDRADLTVSGAVTRRGAMGFVFQRPGTQLVRRVVRQDIAFGLENRGLQVDTIEKRIDHAVTVMDAEALLDRQVRDLSAGETAKVALLGSLVTEPDVLVLDEPVATLDHWNTRLVLDAIDRLRGTGTAVVIAEHDLRDLLTRVEQVVLLSEGRIVGQGEPRELLRALRTAGVKLPFATEAALELRRSDGSVPVPLTDEVESR